MVEPLWSPRSATGMNHGHRRQCVGPRKVAMEAGRPRDAAALARTDLSPHFFCQITGDYIRNVSAFDTRESPKQRFLAGVNQPAKRHHSTRHATRFRGRAMDACRQMRYPAGLLFRRVLRRCAPVAQWIEYCPPKAGVAGSIPAGRAKSSIPSPSRFADRAMHGRRLRRSERLLHAGMRNIDPTQMPQAGSCARMHERKNGAPTPSAVP